MLAVYKTAGASSAFLPSDREIRITRPFAAPRQSIWDAHTQPALIRLWARSWPGWTMSVCEVDLRSGGGYRYEWTNSKGESVGRSGLYPEVEAPRRLVEIQRFEDYRDQGEVVITHILEEVDGRTELTSDTRLTSKWVRDIVVPTLPKDMEKLYAQMEKVVTSHL